LRKIHI